jgi:outer membrane autotransporter protein
MKLKKHLMLLGGLLAGHALFSPIASAQLINGDFSQGATGWTFSGSLSREPFKYTGSPVGLGSAAPVFHIINGTAVLYTDPFNVAKIVTTAMSQTIDLRPISSIPGHLGQGVGRLQLSSFGNVKPSVILKYNFQFLSRESAGALFDYARAQINASPLTILEGRDPATNGPGAFGFIRGSKVLNVTQDISGFFGTTPLLTFFASDTIDNEVSSGLAVSNVQVIPQYVVEDIDAINSVYNSGLPMVLAQRQILLNVAFNANRDVNARLFRLRSEMEEETGSAGPSGYSKDGKESKKEIVPAEKRWSFFANGNYGYRDVNDIDQTAGFQSNLFTATLGAEYRVIPALTVGVAATRVEADNDFGWLGSADIEGWSFDGYVSYAANHFYADLLYALGTYNHQIRRNTTFLDTTATARPDSLTNSIQFNTGYNIQAGRFVTGPLVSLNWVHGNIDGYNEQQGGNADLNVPSQHVNSLTTELGWQFSAPIHTTVGKVTPQVRASWVHEYLNDNKDVFVGLQNSPYYLVNGASVSRIGGFSTVGNTSASGTDYLSLGAGVGCEINDRAAIVLDWETRFFQDHSTAENVSLTGQIKF